MRSTHIVGVDPGIVHTGLVRFVIQEDGHRVVVEHQAIAGPDVSATKKWIESHGSTPDHVYIEGFRQRSHFMQDKQMLAAVRDMAAALPNATVVNNTGVKKVIKPKLMELLGCWRFSTVTNHQDLRSAARIALLGMVKDPELNKLLGSVVVDHLNGKAWNVVV